MFHILDLIHLLTPFLCIIHQTLYYHMLSIPGPHLFRCSGKRSAASHRSYNAADSSLVIGSCFARPIGFPDSNSKPDVDSLGFGTSDSWKCFSSTSHFFGFSPLIPPDESHHSSDPLRPPTQPDPSGKKAPAQLSASLEFRFLTILLIPKRKSLPQTKNMSRYLKINVTTVCDYITFGKVRKLGQSKTTLVLLLHKITFAVFFRLLYILELCAICAFRGCWNCFCSPQEEWL